MVVYLTYSSSRRTPEEGNGASHLGEGDHQRQERPGTYAPDHSCATAHWRQASFALSPHQVRSRTHAPGVGWSAFLVHVLLPAGLFEKTQRLSKHRVLRVPVCPWKIVVDCPDGD
jgi:hypothetical protein